MLVQNRQAMTILLEKVENLEKQNENIERQNEQKNNILIKKIENFEKLLIEIRKDYLPRPHNQNINLLGNLINVSSNNNSKIINFKCSIAEFFENLKEYILITDVVLDIGCGIRPQTFFTPKVHICVEPFNQYREIIKPLFPNRSYFMFLRQDALSSMQALDDNSVDTIFMIDLIEHLEKKDGLLLLKEADRVARKQIIVFTPLGFYPMHFDRNKEKDAWGLDGTDVQEHKSGWLPEDFDSSWNFYICDDCHEAFLPEEKLKGKKYSALMAIKTKNFNGFSVIDETPKFVKDIYKNRIIDGNF